MHVMPPLKTNITGVNNYLSLISLNINGHNSPMKRHKLIDWIGKQDPTLCCIQETHLKPPPKKQNKQTNKQKQTNKKTNHLHNKDRYYLRVTWKKSLPSIWSKKQAGVAILISNKIKL
jgi:exonuclease III